MLDARSEKTDEQLAAAAAHQSGGDALEAAQRAFAALYDRHAVRLLAFLSRRLPRGHVEDAAQEVWARVWKALPAFDGRCFRGWLFRIARNLLVDLRRKTHREPPKRDNPDNDPVEYLLDQERRRAVETCIEKLQTEAARIVRGRCAGVSYQQLCGDLEIQPARAHKIYHLAVKQLSECVKRILA